MRPFRLVRLLVSGLGYGLHVAVGESIGLGLNMIICFDIDFWSCLDRWSGRNCSGRRSTANVDCRHSLYNVQYLGSLTLSILEILDRNELVLTPMVRVGKRVVQLIVRMSNDARAKEY